MVSFAVCHSVKQIQHCSLQYSFPGDQNHPSTVYRVDGWGNLLGLLKDCSHFVMLPCEVKCMSFASLICSPDIANANQKTDCAAVGVQMPKARCCWSAGAPGVRPCWSAGAPGYHPTNPLKHQTSICNHPTAPGYHPTNPLKHQTSICNHPTTPGYHPTNPLKHQTSICNHPTIFANICNSSNDIVKASKIFGFQNVGIIQAFGG